MEKENEAKWFEETQLLLDKQDKIRLKKIHIIQESSPVKQLLKLNEIKEIPKLEKPLKKIVSITNKPIFVRDEESNLKKYLAESM